MSWKEGSSGRIHRARSWILWTSSLRWFWALWYGQESQAFCVLICLKVFSIAKQCWAERGWSRVLKASFKYPHRTGTPKLQIAVTKEGILRIRKLDSWLLEAVSDLESWGSSGTRCQDKIEWWRMMAQPSIWKTLLQRGQTWRWGDLGFGVLVKPRFRECENVTVYQGQCFSIQDTQMNSGLTHLNSSLD